MLKRFIGIGLRKKKPEGGGTISSESGVDELNGGDCSVVSKHGVTKKLNESTNSIIESNGKKTTIFQGIKIATKKNKTKSNKKENTEIKKTRVPTKNISGQNLNKVPESTNSNFRVVSLSKKEKLKSMSKNEIIKKESKNERLRDTSNNMANVKVSGSQSKVDFRESKQPNSTKVEKDSKLVKEPKPLTEGTMIAFNWEIKKTLGKGSFGQVYLAEHTQTHVKIAIKTLLASYQEFRIAMERDVLKLCSEKTYFPKVYLSGMHDIYYCIGMSLLGPSLTDVRKSTKLLKIEAHYCMIVCKQMIYALKTLHELGYVHRDIKPSNICTGFPGTPEAKNICYLIDFGIVRKFIVGGVIIHPKGKGRLRGTMRYLSLNCHQLLELGPADDLHSLYYSIVELGTGHLPWKCCSDIKEVEKMKKEFDFSKHRGDLLIGFHDFWTVTKDVTNIQLPDYDKCVEVIEKCIPDEYKKDNFIFPWHDISTS
ncbi:Casein kinase I [Strongyloides ratti]|uniref:non-specific serine/threonine protein kinase n=1 Tax=Strongyloides ratti TaxID=34506 RepID=A0A090MZE6_STRRB|nr:Casein kinase I [Strongyloides ratti]CEF68799.1 Casein kinase I [Strongyloides ratti]